MSFVVDLDQNAFQRRAFRDARVTDHVWPVGVMPLTAFDRVRRNSSLASKKNTS